MLKRGKLAKLVEDLERDLRKVRPSFSQGRSPPAAPLPASCVSLRLSALCYPSSDAPPPPSAARLPREQVMEPHTARNLRERKDNKLKDFLHVAGPLGARDVTSDVNAMLRDCCCCVLFGHAAR